MALPAEQARRGSAGDRGSVPAAAALVLEMRPERHPSTAAPSRCPSACLQYTRLLSIVWGGALAGIAQCLFFSHAPKALAASL